jgi:hypothetical protein
MLDLWQKAIGEGGRQDSFCRDSIMAELYDATRESPAAPRRIAAVSARPIVAKLISINFL